jgi:multidrug efflux pump subunit AcrA (membrane-fusion protein)
MNHLDAGPDGRDSSAVKTATGAGAPRARSSAGPRPRAAGPAISPSPVKKKRRSKKRFLLPLLLLSAVTIGVAGWWYARSKPAGVEPATTTATVQRRDFSSSVLATGAVKPRVGAEVRVGARISGKVARLRANIGDRVTKGQTVAELEKADLEAIVAQREAELQLAQAKLAAVERLLPKEVDKARLDLARWQATQTLCEQELSREQSLLKAEATSQETFQEAQERLTVTQAQVATAEKMLELGQARYEEELRQATAEVARAQSALTNVQVQLSYATITAPIDGVIASVSTQEGETVAAGFNAPTFVTIIDLDRLQVDAYVDEVDIGRVRPGQEALFTVDTFPGREFKGKVAAIYPKAVIQDNVINYDVVVEILDRDHGDLRPEMTASVTVLLEAKTGVLAIPAKAVKRERGKNVVYVSSNGQPEPRNVTIGWKDGQWIEVLAGLQEGQTVLVEPTPSKSQSN